MIKYHEIISNEIHTEQQQFHRSCVSWAPLTKGVALLRSSELQDTWVPWQCEVFEKGKQAEQWGFPDVVVWIGCVDQCSYENDVELRHIYIYMHKLYTYALCMCGTSTSKKSVSTNIHHQLQLVSHRHILGIWPFLTNILASNLQFPHLILTWLTIIKLQWTWSRPPLCRKNTSLQWEWNVFLCWETSYERNLCWPNCMR